MPDMLDFSLPKLGTGGQEDTKKQLKRLETYLRTMTEQLRFTLANLDPEANFSAPALAQWTNATGGTGGSGGGGGGGGSTATGVEALFARFGSTADITVWKVRTDWEKIDRYLTGDTSPVKYLEILGGEIRFIEARVDGTKTEQLNDGEQLFWYKNGNSREIVKENTGFPVTIYKYIETQKAKIGWDGDIVRAEGIELPVSPTTL